MKYKYLIFTDNPDTWMNRPLSSVHKRKRIVGGYIVETSNSWFKIIKPTEEYNQVQGLTLDYIIIDKGTFVPEGIRSAAMFGLIHRKGELIDHNRDKGEYGNEV